MRTKKFSMLIWSGLATFVLVLLINPLVPAQQKESVSSSSSNSKFIDSKSTIAIAQGNTQVQKKSEPVLNQLGGGGGYWIWSQESTQESAPAGKRYFRKTIELTKATGEISLMITADNSYRVWINNRLIGSGDNWSQLDRYAVNRSLSVGKNVIAVEADNTDGPAGLYVSLMQSIRAKAKSSKQPTSKQLNGRVEFWVSDSKWKVSSTPTDGWTETAFDDSKWGSAKEIARWGDGPWKQATLVDASKGKFVVPQGFKVELVVAPQTRIPGYHTSTNKNRPGSSHNFSLVNMCFDNKGRLLASQEVGPIILCTDPDSNGEMKKISIYCDQVTNCQGMCWIHDSLYLVGNGPDGKKGNVTGLFRCQDTNHDDRIDKVELLHRFQGGMGEHGPHAILHGPDDHLYLVIGNHAWAKPDKLATNSPLRRWPTGGMGKDQDQADSTEDVLLPRLNDANGHAANILAPGGSIWRLDLDGKNMALVASGFRNEFDAAFNPAGELFTFDSDMEWDENLPWYRAVRVCHCSLGADFLWRTGAANTPAYYEDSLPPVVDTGRGSPTGVEFYDHHLFPEKYRGAYFMCDWSIGTIWVVFLEKSGASYKAKFEKFCSSSPMPVTDCVVGPEGALYFSLGGRNTQGAIYRIVPEKMPEKIETLPNDQPLAAWSPMRNQLGKVTPEMLKTIADQIKQGKATPEQMVQWMKMISVAKAKDFQDKIVFWLQDQDANVRRVALETLLNLEINPELSSLVPLLKDEDRFVRTTARLVLQRQDAKSWAKTLIENPSDRVARSAIIALCKLNEAEPYTDQIFERLHQISPGEQVDQLLEWLRVLELALVHTKKRPGSLHGIAIDCLEMFPHRDYRVNRELAILLSEFARTKELPPGVVTKIVAALSSPESDRLQQIHYFYCLRLIKEGWTSEDKMNLIRWFENTKSWQGGNSFRGFLLNIFRDCSAVFNKNDTEEVLKQFDKYPLTALLILRSSSVAQGMSAKVLAELYGKLNSLPSSQTTTEGKNIIIGLFGQSKDQDAAYQLKLLASKEPGLQLTVALALAKNPNPDNLDTYLGALGVAQRPSVITLLDAIAKSKAKPKLDNPVPFRQLLLASTKLPEEQRWKIVEILRGWTGKQFGASKPNWKPELNSWSLWFGQNFPKEKPLPNLSVALNSDSKYKYDDLIRFLENDPKGKKGDVAKGKLVFEKALCIKCHKYGEAGEGIGPDLSAVAKRFKRREILESIYYPSKIISDQYRSTKIVTEDGRTIIGLVSELNGVYTILQQDATRLTLKKNEVSEKYDSLISVMPTNLLDNLTMEEIADLFAFMDIPVPEKK